MGATLQALALTLMGAAGTALGGLMVVAQPRMDYKRLGLLQGLAGGLMLSISLIDLLPEAAEDIGFELAHFCFYVGVAFFAVIVACIPAPDDSVVKLGTHRASSSNLLAQAARASGGKDSGDEADGDVSDCAAGAAAPAAGRRRSVRMAPLPPKAAQPVAATAAAAADDSDEALELRKVLMSGLVTAVGIALHNFPEGVAVYLASHKSSAIGASLAVAIALHNIPEGVAVALPVYFATGSRMRGLWTATLSGLAEPAAVVVLGLLLPVQLGKSVVGCCLAGVAGIMAFLSFHELLPLAIKHTGRSAAVGSLFAGMALMTLNLWLLNTYFGVEH